MKRIKSNLTGVLLVILGLFLGSVLVGDGVAQGPNSGTEGHLAKWVKAGKALGNSVFTENSDGTLGVPQGIKFGDGTTQTTASSGNDGIDQHHQELSFTLSPQEQVTIPLPKLDRPVRVEVGIQAAQTRQCPTCTIHMSGPILMSSVYYFDTSFSNFADWATISRCSAMPYGDFCAVLFVNPSPPSIVVGISDQNGVISPTVTYNVNLWY